MKTCIIEIALTIPDNEAYTAKTTLRRLGVDVGDVLRGDLWRFETEDAHESELLDRVRTLETIYNPNKHALRVRTSEIREPGEVWIDDPGYRAIEGPRFGMRIAGRKVLGVSRVDRYTSWRLFADDGSPASRDLVEQAVEKLLCHPAFQREII
jgi:hypothetical protein